MRFLLLACLCAAISLAPPVVTAQPAEPWQMQVSGSTASLRGIDSVDGTIAWASGTEGTVLKTTDGGVHWQKCAVPDGDKDGATLDFRGVQAWDAQTAIVMASGPGDKSRLYKTTDGCKSWKLLYLNPDKDGFWDALNFGISGDGKGRGRFGWLLGDPVNGAFSLFVSSDSGTHWVRQRNTGLTAAASAQGAFAASNSSLLAVLGATLFGSGGSGGAFTYSESKTQICVDVCSPKELDLDGSTDKWSRTAVSVGKNTESSGIFSIGSRIKVRGGPLSSQPLVAVGGEYTKPDNATETAAWSSDGGQHWTASTAPPHGYRSTVQWSKSEKLWITAGTNGSDISRDDGKTWQRLDDGNWNALSLPFIVGPKGRIAKLNPAALPRP